VKLSQALSLQKDFREEKPLLQLIIEKVGHKCLFLPKFHCELNPIEMVWGQVKQSESVLTTVLFYQSIFVIVFRGLADGTFKKAQELVPDCLDAVTVTNIRKYFRHCWRYMDAYR
jgi:hypothetical protein